MFEFFTNCILVACANLITTNVNVTPNQQLHCDYYTIVDTYNHAMCTHFHHPLDMTFIINRQQ
jgi:hypothetical protein